MTLFLQGLYFNPVGISVRGMFLSLISFLFQMILFLQGLYFNPVGISVGGMFLVTKESALTVSSFQILKIKQNEIRRALTSHWFINSSVMIIHENFFLSEARQKILIDNHYELFVDKSEVSALPAGRAYWPCVYRSWHL